MNWSPAWAIYRETLSRKKEKERGRVAGGGGGEIEGGRGNEPRFLPSQFE
jgi:hypothetical protein